ncbi:hypothetical protein BBP40_004134 [Aspergillus hancockii]|nr:hypothetical protein BBP40_004134 [Aspergillus hancockii]
MALGLLAHLLEPDENLPWKRVLCMGVSRGLYTEPGLVRLIYSLYNGDKRRKDILKEHMAALVRLASEKPSLIGVSTRSTVPSRAEHSRSITEEQITLEAGGVAGVIGTSVPSTYTNVPGISNQWSIVRTPYMELLDKTDPPPPPDTYIYSLDLNCISSFAKGLAKYILPLTVPDLKQKRRSRIASPDKSMALVTSSIGAFYRAWPQAGMAYTTTFRSEMMIAMLGNTDFTVEGSMPVIMQPQKRTGRDEEIVGAVLYYASVAGAYCSGSIHVVGGGRPSIQPGATY